MKNSETISAKPGSVNLNEKRAGYVKEIEALQHELENIDKEINKTTPVKVYNFIAQPQGSTFVLGLVYPSVECCGKDYGLPGGYKGRGSFTAGELREIAKGLLGLAGESDE